MTIYDNGYCKVTITSTFLTRDYDKMIKSPSLTVITKANRQELIEKIQKDLVTKPIQAKAFSNW